MANKTWWDPDRPQAIRHPDEPRDKTKAPTPQIPIRPGLVRYEWRGTPVELANMGELHKTGRRMICKLASHPIGWELRVTIGDELIRSEACRTQERVLDLSDEWRVAAEAKGWKTYELL